MKDFKFKVTSVFLFLSLLGLIVVQLYWIQSAFTLKNNEFNSLVAKAAEQVINKYEQDESLNILTSSQFANSYINNPSSLLVDDDIDRDTIITKENNGDYRIEIIESNKTDSSSGIVTSTITKIFSKTMNQVDYIERENFEFDKTGLTKEDSLNIMLKQYVNHASKFEKKSEMINQIINYIKIQNQKIPVKERIKSSFLDSLIKNTFYQLGYKGKVKYLLLDKKAGNNVLCNPYNLKLERIKNVEYDFAFFPNDLVSNQVYIQFYFPNRGIFIVDQIKWILFVSALFILIIVYAFIYSYKRLKEEQKLGEIKNDFINNMTHELKTPISTITLACEALHDPDLGSSPKSKARYLGLIEQENNRLGMLVEKVLQAAISENGKLKLSKEQFNLSDTMNSICDSFEMKVRKNYGTLIKDIQPNIFIEADKIHISNVIYNLIDNAIKYSSDKIEIVIELEKKSEGILIKVKDKGIGIKKEYQKRIFDKLYRVPTGDLHDVKGFGIGLSYVKTIVRLHQGNISLDSEWQKGSEFLIFLPHK